jgi:dTDP-4-dehydrorhamnose 3,5-epimerase-like enzyme
VVTQDVPPRAIVSGNPARIVGYVDVTRKSAVDVAVRVPAAGATVTATSVKGVTVHQLNLAHDLRGTLAAAEFPGQLPFAPKRFFLVYEVPGKEVRGEHAHRACRQFLVCIRGSLSVVVDDGTASEEVTLDRPDLGLYLPALVWAVQYKYSSDALLLVLASDPYDPADYIRDYDEFLSAIAR